MKSFGYCAALPGRVRRRLALAFAAVRVDRTDNLGLDHLAKDRRRDHIAADHLVTSFGFPACAA